MDESIGKQLTQARHKRGLTIDEVAHATKLRPDKITALENDDYTRFANSIYAKGFLQIYARFLNVDVSEFARTLDNANPISVGDYQYLSNAPAPRRDTSNTVRHDDRRPPSFAPLVIFVLFLALAGGGYWIYRNYQRIEGEKALTAANHAKDTSTPAPNPDAAFITATPPPVAPAPNRPAAATPATAAAKGAPSTPAPGFRAVPALATPAPLGAFTPTIKAPDHDVVSPAPVATNDPSARPMPPSGVNEVLVAAVKKTWVTVRKDDPNAKPIFEDYVYPTAHPLKLRGARFFIEARDPASVQITKNGLPVAYQPTGAAVQ